MFFCQFLPQLARIATALVPAFNQVILIGRHFLLAPFSVHDSHALGGLIQLQIVLDRAARHAELAGNGGTVGFFAVEVMHLVVAFHPLLIEGLALFSLPFAYAILPGTSRGALCRWRSTAGRPMNGFFEQGPRGSGR